MKNINKFLPALLTVALCAAGAQSLWGMQDLPERKRTAAASEETYFDEAMQARLAVKQGDTTGKAFVPAPVKNLIAARYPLSKEALTMLNEYTFRTNAEGEVRTKEAKAQKESAAVSEEALPQLKSFVFSRDFKKLIVNTPAYSDTYTADGIRPTIFEVEKNFAYRNVLPKARCAFPALSPDATLLAMDHNCRYIFTENLIDENDFPLTTPLDINPYRTHEIFNSPSMVFSHDGSHLHVYAHQPGQADQYIITYSISTKTVTNRVAFDADFLRDKKIMGLLPDGSCIFKIHLMIPDDQNPDGPKIQDRPIAIARYNPATKELIPLLDLQAKHYCSVAFDYVNHCILLEEHCDIKKIALFNPITRETIFTNNPVDFPTEGAAVDNNDSESDTDDASSSAEHQILYYTGLETVNVQGNAHIEGFGNGALKFTRLQKITFDDPKSQTFDPKLLPFIDWLYTTQKERNFKPLTLTQEGWKLFKQLDEFSQTALMRNLQLREPRAIVQTSTQITKPVEKAKEVKPTSCIIQ